MSTAKKQAKPELRRYQLFFLAIAIVSALAIALNQQGGTPAFDHAIANIVPTSTQSAATRHDLNTTDDLLVLAASIYTYTSSNGALPASLSQLNTRPLQSAGTPVGARVSSQPFLALKMPVANYHYQVTGPSAYKVCADFDTAVRSVGAAAPGFDPAVHTKGSNCFTGTVQLPSPQFLDPSCQIAKYCSDAIINLTVVKVWPGQPEVSVRSQSGTLRLLEWDPLQPPRIIDAAGHVSGPSALAPGQSLNISPSTNPQWPIGTIRIVPN